MVSASGVVTETSFSLRDRIGPAEDGSGGGGDEALGAIVARELDPEYAAGPRRRRTRHPRARAARPIHLDRLELEASAFRERRFFQLPTRPPAIGVARPGVAPGLLHRAPGTSGRVTPGAAGAASRKSETIAATRFDIAITLPERAARATFLLSADATENGEVEVLRSFTSHCFRFNRYGPLAALLRTSMALTEFSNALSKTRLPMVPSTKPSTRPLRFLPSRTTTTSMSVVPLG